MNVRFDNCPPGFVPKIFPVSIQLEGETNGDQIDNLREAIAITLLDLVENRIIECDGRKKQEVKYFAFNLTFQRDFGVLSGIGTFWFPAFSTKYTQKLSNLTRIFNCTSPEDRLLCA